MFPTQDSQLTHITYFIGATDLPATKQCSAIPSTGQTREHAGRTLATLRACLLRHLGCGWYTPTAAWASNVSTGVSSGVTKHGCEWEANLEPTSDLELQLPLLDAMTFERKPDSHKGRLEDLHAHQSHSQRHFQGALEDTVRHTPYNDTHTCTHTYEFTGSGGDALYGGPDGAVELTCLEA